MCKFGQIYLEQHLHCARTIQSVQQFLLLDKDLSAEEALWHAQHNFVLYSVANKTRTFGAPSTLQSLALMQVERVRMLRGAFAFSDCRAGS